MAYLAIYMQGSRSDAPELLGSNPLVVKILYSGVAAVRWENCKDRNKRRKAREFIVRQRCIGRSGDGFYGSDGGSNGSIGWLDFKV